MAAVRHIVLGTRGSALALRQAGIVQARLKAQAPDVEVALQTLVAQADLQAEMPLAAMAGEGIFVKELEAALLQRRIDLAVHSLKDLPLEEPNGVHIAAVLTREEARDALVARHPSMLATLAPRARVGTSSPRRRGQLLHARGDLQVMEMRGNVDTRLRKLDEGRYDAIVVAACGLIRLGLQARISQLLDVSVMLPEPGQGALAIETRAEDAAARDLAGRLDDPATRACVEAERAFLRALGGGCRVPIAAHATIGGGKLVLAGAVTAVDGHQQVRGVIDGPADDPARLGADLAAQLVLRGAKELLQ